MKERRLESAILTAGLLACLPFTQARAEDPGTQMSEPYTSAVESAETAIRGWPKPAATVARMLIDKYGQPETFSSTMLLWRNNGTWKRTIVYRDGTQAPGKATGRRDVLQQVVSYHVPLDKFPDLARFDNRVVADRTRDELSAVSDSEKKNFLALNLADEIVSGWKDPATALRTYARIIDLDRAGKSSPYTEGLRFIVRGENDPKNPGSSGTVNPDSGKAPPTYQP